MRRNLIKQCSQCSSCCNNRIGGGGGGLLKKIQELVTGTFPHSPSAEFQVNMIESNLMYKSFVFFLLSCTTIRRQLPDKQPITTNKRWPIFSKTWHAQRQVLTFTLKFRFLHAKSLDIHFHLQFFNVKDSAQSLAVIFCIHLSQDRWKKSDRYASINLVPNN